MTCRTWGSRSAVQQVGLRRHRAADHGLVRALAALQLLLRRHTAHHLPQRRDRPR